MIQVLLFAELGEQAGQRELTLTVEETTVAAIKLAVKKTIFAASIARAGNGCCK